MITDNFDIIGTFLHTVRATSIPERPAAVLVDLARRSSGSNPILYEDLWRAAVEVGYSADQFIATLQELRAARFLVLHTDLDPVNPPVELTPEGRRAAVLLN